MKRHINNAKKLRTNMTEAEKRLWYHLRNRRTFDLKFRRQKPINNYIADFVCYEKRLIIELDGSQHAESFTDKIRDTHLNSQNFKIIRIWNNEIMSNIDGVLEFIKTKI